VVGLIPREHLAGAGELAGELHRRLVGLAAGDGEEHVVQVAGRDLGEAGSEFRAGVVVLRRGDVGDFRGLFRDGVGDSLLAVAGVDTVELCDEVEIRRPVVVVDGDALAVDDGEGVVVAV